MSRIVVGVDGSENANRALAWAVDEAQYRAATLHLIHSWKFPPAMPLPDGGIAPADFEGVANDILEAAKALVPADVSVETEVANELAAQALIRASEGAALVVIGARGIGGFKGLLLGSVSQQVSHHARCPIVIVPQDR